MHDITAQLAAALAVRDDGLPPSGNTGAEITGAAPPARVRLFVLPPVVPRARPAEGVGCSVGWLSATWVGHFSTLEEFQAWAAPFLGELALVPRRWRGYEVVLAGEHGVLLGVRVRDGDVLELHLDVPAQVLDSLHHGALYVLLRCAALYAQNVTRSDVTLDDWQKVITPMELDALTSDPSDPHTLLKDKIVTHVKSSADFHRSKGPRGGDTWYLGGKSGGALLRVYDKARESQGEVDAIRWELQLRGDRAKDAVVALVVAADELAACSPGMTAGAALAEVMGEQWASQLVRFVDFRDRSQDSNVSRCPRLPWFVALVLNAGRAAPVVVKPVPTLPQMHDYASVALPSWVATLADSAPFVCGVSPELWLLALLEDGRKHRSRRHDALLTAGLKAHQEENRERESRLSFGEAAD